MNATGYTHKDIVVYKDGTPLTLQEYCSLLKIQVPREAKHEVYNLYNIGSGLRVEGGLYQGDLRIILSIGEEKMKLNHNQWKTLITLANKLTGDLEKVKAGENVQTSASIGDSVCITINSPNRVFHIHRNDEARPAFSLYEPEWFDLLHLKNHLSRAPRTIAEDC